LMVPPLVSINARYYGWRVALYIAGIMYVSIVVTALLLTGIFAALSVTPNSGREVEKVTRFALDYTFWMNLVMVLVAALLVRFHREHLREHVREERQASGAPSIGPKRLAALSALLVLTIGLVIYLVAP
ncbi:MAG: hypothetical protein R3322_20535, partial [Kiloniellales bacterium]|nr:hypothetical protein [Kiloniellales bacterium]